MKALTSLIYMINVHQKNVRTLADEITELLKGVDVTLLRGKYKGRRAQVQEYHHQLGGHTLNVFIYRQDKKEGFKGKEKFIDDHHAEYVRLEDVQFDGEEREKK